MPSDLEPGQPDPRRTVAFDARTSGRPEKPLGRGLEDISQLFLSRRASDVPGREPAPTRVPVITESVLLRPQKEFTREQLATAIRKFDGALEERLKVIDGSVTCDPFGEIDLLAVDRTNQLVIIDCDTAASDALLTRGLAHVDWVVRNVAILRRMYRGEGIDFLLHPRLCLVAAQFSVVLRSGARQVSRPQVACVKCHAAEVFGGTGLLFEPLEE